MPRRETRTASGHRISYLVEGSGPALVLLSSALESAQGWAEFGYVHSFSDAYTVVAVDLVGQGQSDRSLDPADYSWERILDQLTSVLDAEGIGSASVWGYANGAEVAWLLARRRPRLVSALVLGGVYLGEGMIGDDQIDHAAVISAMAEALDTGDWHRYFDLFPIDWGERSRARMQMRNDAAVAAASTRGDLTRPRGVVAPNIPTLAYWGAEVSFSAANADLVPGLPLESLTVPGNQGDAFLDSDAIIGPVRHFLDGLR